jgi:signal peptidase I
MSKKVLEYIKSFGIAIILALLIRSTIIQAFKIPSGSMLDTLKIGDHLFVTKFIYNVQIDLPLIPNIKLFPVIKPKRGHIIVFQYPVEPNRDFIKRCIGIPGDKIEIKDKVVYVNDKPIEESYIKHVDPMILPANDDQLRDNYGPVVVPQDKYFMMGDNRDTSSDSRFWGFLDKKYIKGKALIIYWPIWRIGLIK